MAKQKAGTDAHVAKVVYALNRRRTRAYIPLLEKKIAELEQKLEAAQPPAGETPGTPAGEA